MEINFQYQKKKYTIKCNEGDYIDDVCNKFQNIIKLKRVIYLYEENKINLDCNMTVGQLIQLNIKKKYEIKVVDVPIQIKFNYNLEDINLTVKESETMLDILKRFSTKVNKNLDDIYFLYNGNLIDEYYYNETFDSYANKWDRENNSMAIYVCDMDRDSLNEINLDEIDSIKRERFQSNEERDFYLKLELKYIKY